MEQEGSNIWSSKLNPPRGVISYYYKFYINPEDAASFEKTHDFELMPSLPHHVHHDVLLPNLPTAFFLGMVYHLQEIYGSIEESNVQSRITEMVHVLFPNGELNPKPYKECLPVRKYDLKTNSLLLWIIDSIRDATSTDQLTCLAALVAHMSFKKLHSGLDIINMIGDDELRKLIGSLHKTHRDHVDWDTYTKLKTLVQTVLKALREFHWLYIVLYCYPFFDQDHIMDYKHKSFDKSTPSMQCISDIILPRVMNSNMYNRKIIQEITKLQEKLQKRGTASHGKYPVSFCFKLKILPR